MKESPLHVSHIAILFVLIGGIFFILSASPASPSPTFVATSTQGAATASTFTASTTPEKVASAATSTPSVQEVKKDTPVTTAAAPEPATNSNEIRRINDPYPTDPLSFDTVNPIARSAVVNIFCFSANNGLLRPISGSGVFIDSKGVILTNAHVAQYVLLSESGRVDMDCEIRMGTPAKARWIPHVVYLPPVWIDEHAADLTKDKPLGTGKHDYALLFAGAPLDGVPRPAIFPALSIDTRNAIGFVDDAILAASYPAEFLGSLATNFDLYAVSSVSTIRELFTLDAGTVDVISIGSVIGAQSGSSGGAIVNAWAKLIGLITTTSNGDTTGERELRGITMSYIDRDMAIQSGTSLTTHLLGNPAMQSAEFSARYAPALVEKLLSPFKNN